MRKSSGVAWPKLPEFQCRLFGDGPVAEPAAAGGRSNIIIISVRPNRRERIAPKKKWRRRPAAAAPPRRLNQIARVGLLTELGVSAPASRAREGNESGYVISDS